MKSDTSILYKYYYGMEVKINHIRDHFNIIEDKQVLQHLCVESILNKSYVLQHVTAGVHLSLTRYSESLKYLASNINKCMSHAD